MSGGRRVAVALAALLVAAVLAGCGSKQDQAPPPVAGPGVGVVSTAADGAQEITLQTQDDYLFLPAAFTVRPGTVRLTVHNAARSLTHAFRFTPGGGPATIAEQITILPPGQSETIQFAVSTAGAYRYECSFHTALGQVGTMTVAS